MMKKNPIVLILPFVFLFAVSCGSGPRSDGAGDALVEVTDPAVEEEAVGDHEIHVEPEQIEEWGIVAGAVTTTDLVSSATLPGVIELSVDLGRRVRQGQTLLTVNSPDFASAQAAYLEAFANYRFSSEENDRAVELFREKAIEEREYRRRVTYLLPSLYSGLFHS